MRAFLSAHAAMLRAWAVIVAAALLCAALGGVLASYLELGWWWGLVPVAVMLVFGEAVVLMTPDDPVDRRESVELTPDTAPRAHAVLDRLCALSGWPRPRLRLLDLEGANALTHICRDGVPTVYVSADLLTELEAAELEAVLAHELSHVAHRDQRLLMFATAITQWPVYLTAALHTAFEWWDVRLTAVARRQGRDWETVLTAKEDKAEVMAGLPEVDPAPGAAAGPVGALVVVLRIATGLVYLFGVVPLIFCGAVLSLPGLAATAVLSRQRELAADRAAAELTGAPSVLAATLSRLEEHRDALPTQDLRRGVDAMAIVALPAKTGRVLGTHPPVERRMEILREQSRNLYRSGTDPRNTT
ncbi:M48 family metalloprotease [Nocardiopsis ganjiahuensis]|uniref:M48 family metalloprotease n=1 Tax=Nocardiopsis ganjiahuensis TaxID=239984 RepID=UPI00034637AA|nr:M48 family metalloprotease [Nocardiopsis ganjiahuensis]